MNFRTVVTNLFLVGVFSCGGSAQRAEAPASDVAASCRQAAENLADQMYLGTGSNPTPEQRSQTTQLFTDGCIEDQWSADVRACYIGLQDGQNPDLVCEAKMTPEQERAMQRRLKTDQGPGEPGGAD